LKANFAGYQTHRKRGKSARASPSPHHTSHEERTARFIAQTFPALIGTFPWSDAAKGSRVAGKKLQPSGLAHKFGLSCK